jgi:hypothetical protein
MFLFSSFMSAALRLVSLLLYQTAIQLAPLSVTIPYLSFTPAMLIVTAYLMIGEQPSWPGLIGSLPETVIQLHLGNSIFPIPSCEMGCRIWAGLDWAARLSKLADHPLHLCGVQSRVHTAEVLPCIRVKTRSSPDKSPLLLLQTVGCLGIHENVAINIAACPTVSAIEFEKHT